MGGVPGGFRINLGVKVNDTAQAAARVTDEVLRRFGDSVLNVSSSVAKFNEEMGKWENAKITLTQLDANARKIQRTFDLIEDGSGTVRLQFAEAVSTSNEMNRTLEERARQQRILEDQQKRLNVELQKELQLMYEQQNLQSRLSAARASAFGNVDNIIGNTNLQKYFSKASIDSILAFRNALDQFSISAVKSSVAQQRINQLFDIAVSGNTTALTQQLQNLTTEEVDVANAANRVANAVQRMKAEFEGTLKPSQQVKKHIDDITISWESFQRLIIARAVTAVFYNLQNYLLAARDRASELSIKIGEIQTVASESERNVQTYKRLEKQLLAVSNAYNIPVLEAAEVAYEGLSNQLAETANEILAFTSAAVELSKVAVGTANDAQNAIASVLNSYNLSVAESFKVSESLFKLIDLGRIRLEDFADSIGTVTSVGAQLGISLADINTSLEVMTIKGIPPAVAMTLLRNIMLKLQDPTEKMKNLLDEWGTPTAEAAAATFGFTGILEKMLDQAKLGSDNLAELSGTSRTFRGYVALLSDDMNDFNKAMGEFNEKSSSFESALKARLAVPAEKINAELNKINNFFTEVWQDIITDLADFDKELEHINLDLNGVVKGFASITGYVVLLGTVYAVVQQIGGAIGRIPKDLQAINSLTGSIKAGIVGVLITGEVLLLSKLFSAYSNSYEESARTVKKDHEKFIKDLFNSIAEVAEATRKEIEETYSGFLKENADVLKQITEVQKANAEELNDLFDIQIVQMEKQVDLLEDKRDIIKDNISEINKEIKAHETLIDKIEKEKFDTALDREKFMFDRNTRGLNDYQQAVAGFSEAQFLAAQAVQLFNQYADDPQGLRDHVDEINKLKDAAFKFAQESDQNLFKLAQKFGPQVFEQFGKQFGTTDSFFSGFFGFEDQLNQALQDAAGQQIDALQNDLFDEQENLRIVNDALKAQKDNLEQIEKVRSRINKIINDDSLNADEIERAVQNEYIYLESILGQQNDINLALEKRVELEKSLRDLRSNAQTLIDTKNKEEILNADLEEAESSAGSNLTSTLDQITDFTVVLDDLQSAAKFFRNTDQDIAVLKSLDDGKKQLLDYEKQLQSTNLTEEERIDILKQMTALYNQLQLVANNYISQKAREGKAGLGGFGFGESFLANIAEDLFNSAETLGPALIATIEQQQSLKDLAKKYNDVLALRIRLEADHKTTLDNVVSSMQNYNVAITIDPSKVAESLKAIRDRRDALNEEAVAARAAANANNAYLASQGLAVNPQAIEPIQRAWGGLVDWSPKGLDNIPALLRMGEFVVNPDATKKFLPLLKAINSNSVSPRNIGRASTDFQRFDSFPDTNINNSITLNTSSSESYDARRLLRSLRREQQRNTGSLTNKRLPVR